MFVLLLPLPPCYSSTGTAFVFIYVLVLGLANMPMLTLAVLAKTISTGFFVGTFTHVKVPTINPVGVIGGAYMTHNEQTEDICCSSDFPSLPISKQVSRS
jgi:hypothetical protein